MSTGPSVGSAEPEAVPCRSEELAAGIRAELPLLLGVIPFGMIYGALALGAALPMATSQSMSAVVFAGSAQFVIVQMVGAGVPAAMLVPTVLVVNLRHALYSASLAPYLGGLSSRWRLVLSYLLTDEAYAVAIVRFRQAGAAAHRHWFLLGAGLTLWAGWQASTLVGIVLGAGVPAEWSLDFALPLTFIAMLAPLVQGRASVAAVVAAGTIAALGYELPLKLAIVVAAGGGVAAGVVVDWIQKRRS